LFVLFYSIPFESSTVSRFLLIVDFRRIVWFFIVFYVNSRFLSSDCFDFSLQIDRNYAKLYLSHRGGYLPHTGEITSNVRRGTYGKLYNCNDCRQCRRILQQPDRTAASGGGLSNRWHCG
jgi:hypothetical protein